VVHKEIVNLIDAFVYIEDQVL